MDPLASYLAGFTDLDGEIGGIYNRENEELWAEMTEQPPSFRGQASDTIDDLARTIDQGAGSTRCVFKRMYEALLDRPINRADSDALTLHDEAFLQGGQAFRALLKSLINDATYRGRTAIGNFTLVDHENRPMARRYFERFGNETMVINGVSTRSMTHEVCSLITLTGHPSGSSPDWQPLIASQSRLSYSMPSLVIGGPTFSADLETYSARSGDAGQLNELINGKIAIEAQMES